jgi:hypothetical protein
MEQFKAIFIRYFTIFSSVLFSLVSFWQYKEQGKFDLKFSLPFSILIATLGATIAAIFIGVVRKQEAEPPRVQPAEYLQVDDLTINTQLKKIRHKRILLFAMFVLWLPYGALVMALNLPEFFIIAYMATLAIVAFILQFAKCPRCGYYFQFRSAKSGQLGDTGSEILNMLFGGGYRNFLSNKCLNCGLNIKIKESI